MQLIVDVQDRSVADDKALEHNQQQPNCDVFDKKLEIGIQMIESGSPEVRGSSKLVLSKAFEANFGLSLNSFPMIKSMFSITIQY